MLFELLLGAVVLSMIGFAVYSYNQNKNTQAKFAAQSVPSASPKSTTPTPTPNPTAGWKSYTLKYEKLTFKYPVSFKLTDESSTFEMVDTGTDKVTLTSNSGLVMHINTGVTGIGGACGNCSVVYTEPITLAGKAMHLNFVDNADLGSAGQMEAVDVATTSDDLFGGFDDKNIKVVDDGTKAAMFVYFDYQGKDGQAPTALATFKNSADLNNGKLIIQSMHY